MRETKYQLWVTDSERMYQVINLDVEPQNGKRKRVTVWEPAIIKGKVGTYWLEDGVILRQYTGLKDKNGVEIYEDDLLKNTCGRIGDVVWDKYHALWDSSYVRDIEANTTTYEKSHGFEPRLWDQFVEVIGNIYENPELLKGNK